MEISTPEIHTLIIWSKALDKKETIKEEILKSFEIRNIFKIHWDTSLFAQNLRVFYAHSQKHLNPSEYDSLLNSKINHCGSNDFYLFVIEDLHPVYELMKTSSGEDLINVNIFGLKQALRNLTDGGHKIHTSNNFFECNKDLTLLLGKNLEDYLNSFAIEPNNVIEYNQNCSGVGGFTSIQQFFYILNNAIEYVVLRNFECLPDQYTLEGHGDIDLLVENKNYIVYLTGSESVYPELDYRVHYRVKIGGENIPFDFRYLGDNYYDLKWQINILKTKILFNDIVYVPNDTNHFYSLLYHAFVQKPGAKADYHIKLKNLSNTISMDYDSSLSTESIKGLLNDFLEKNNYSYTVANDKSVYFNKLFTLDFSKTTSAYGKKIGQSQSRFDNQLFFSEVYEKENVITKIASKEIIEKEVIYLKKLAEFDYFPKYISHQFFENYGIIQMSKMEGVSVSKIKNNKHFWKKSNLVKFIKDAKNILKLLVENNISHRDIRPDNLILKIEKNHCQLYLIDFGWSVDLNSRNNLTPNSLGSSFKFKGSGFSDAYSMGKILFLVFNRLSFSNRISKGLLAIVPEDYGDFAKVIDKISLVPIDFEITFKDQLKILVFKNLFLKKIIKKFLNLLQ